MSSWTEPAFFQKAVPKMIKYCKTCQRETTHEISGGAGVVAVICIPCLNRALTYELERD
jgi:hypothetical protein